MQTQTQKPELYKNVPSEWSDFFPIYDEAVATAPVGSTLIEIGSFWGKSAIYLAEAAKLANKQLKVYCIDPWGARPENNPGLFDPAHGANGHIEPVIHAQHHDSLFETFAYYVEQSRLSPDPLRVMRMESLEAASLFELSDHYIHFIFLDGDHEYDYVYRELMVWAKQIEDGGIIAGHDYTEEFDGVRRATRDYFDVTMEGLRGSVSVECGRSWVVRVA
jgi:Methyltransferase domain